MNKKTKSTSTKTVAAFFNWAIITPSGKEIRCDKGMPLFQNPEYPSPKEDMLIEMAEANGGWVEVPMRVRIALNKEKSVISGADLLKELNTPIKPVIKKKAA